MNQRYGVFALWLLFVGMVAFLIFSAASTAGFNWWGWIPYIIMFLLIVIHSYGEVAPFLRVPTYINVAGGYGKVVGGPFQLQGGRVRYLLAVTHKLVPESYRSGGTAWKNFEASTAGSRIIAIEDFAHNFHWVEPKYRDTPEEVLFHTGSLAGISVPSQTDYLSRELHDAQLTLSKLSTIYDKAKGLSETESRENVDKFIDIFQKGHTMLKEWRAKQEVAVVPSSERRD